jgi:hypothetical protein
LVAAHLTLWHNIDVASSQWALPGGTFVSTFWITFSAGSSAASLLARR